MSRIPAEHRTRVIIAFAAVYVIWGSTYLFIKYAIEAIPPFMMGASRFLLAGAMLYAFALWRGAAHANRHDVRSAAATGILMLGVGNAAVMWSELTVPSGVVALIVSTVPIWVVMIDWLRPRGVRPRLPVFAGLALGIAGMVILIGPRAFEGRGHVNEIGALVLLVGSVSWALGTILSKGSKRSGSPLVYSAVQMLSAAAAMLVASLVTGEPARFSFAALSWRAALSWVYLVLAGSIIGYTAYIYLLGKVSATKAATYAYVNPVIAVLLGWAFANETVGVRTLAAAAVILSGVALITLTQAGARAVTAEHPVPFDPHDESGTERQRAQAARGETIAPSESPRRVPAAMSATARDER